MNLIKSRRGSILIGIVIAVGLAVFSIFYYQSQTLIQSVERTYSQVLSISLDNQRLSLRSLVRDLPSLNRTLNEAVNSTLKSCKVNGAFDCPTGEHDLVVYDRSGVVAFDTRSSSTSGLSKLGIPCSTFNNSIGNSDCPYRYKIVWMADCPPHGPCSLPTLYIKGTVEYKSSDASSSRINTNNYQYIFSI